MLFQAIGVTAAKVWTVCKFVSAVGAAGMVGLAMTFVVDSIGDSSTLTLWRILITVGVTLIGTLLGLAYRDIARRLTEGETERKELATKLDNARDTFDTEIEEHWKNWERQHRQLISAMMMVLVALNPDKAVLISEGMKHLVGE